MTAANLEHVNITVSDAKQTANMLCKLFDWQIRWEGDAIHNGYSVHVGSDDSYLALYTGSETKPPSEASYETISGLNHIAVVVDDLDQVEQRVLEAGYKTYSHADYEPGRRFYFDDADGIEIEVVSYS